ncbi:MAG: HDIG domain-containing protein [Phycisphaerales bacterium]|nr:HDIG domain-containing protein [Phycisphaerales bacterium]
MARPDRAAGLRRVVHHPAFLPDVVIAICFVLALTFAFFFTQDALLLTPGRVMSDTRAVRVEFPVRDQQATEIVRRQERNATSWVFDLNVSWVDSLKQELQSLPEALANAETLDAVSPEIRERFDLNEEQLQSLRAVARAERDLSNWKKSTERFIEQISTRDPILRSERYQEGSTSGPQTIELRVPGRKPIPVAKNDAINLSAPDFRTSIQAIANDKSLYGAHAEILVQRLANEPQPTHIFNSEETEAARERNAARVELKIITYHPGDLIYVAGDRLSAASHLLAAQEHEAFLASRTVLQTWERILGALLTAALAAAVLGGYMRFYYPRILLRPWRLCMVAALIVVASVGACWLTTTYPAVLWFGITGPTAFVAMIGVIAYDRRLAFALAVTQAMLVALALSLPMGGFAVGVTAAAVGAWRFHEIRDRRDMIFGALLTGIAASLTLVVTSVITLPLVEGVLADIAAQAIQAGFGGFLAGVTVLVILPYIERLFDITTGMTLTELRDSRQPILRELQQRAPGTYSHSLNVASLAEAAADAIGADARHTYVGALYHDIGKMNKPDYFVENQARGQNRHAKLSPAMSLLVIVGHVKDGMEIAREYGLPRSLHHYIESHHGTTLVEYFYDQARRQADEDGSRDVPAEIEYRYPGPRPRTREAAILMLCDAVESATRAMTDPTPARIQALVSELARKRLLDGQFDESSLTLAEIKVIEEVVAKQLCSMYHGRIAYPEKKKVAEKDGRSDKEKKAAATAS